MLDSIFCSINNLAIYLNKNFTLEIDHLNIPRANLVMLLGENGAGKTTLLRAILGHTVKRGSIILGDQGEIDSCSKIHRAKLMSYLPAHDYCAFNFSVEELINLGFPAVCDMSQSERKKRVYEVIELLKIPQNTLQARIYSLSSGERKKVFLGRVLVSNPEALLLDEPFSHLDPFNTQEFIEHLRSLVTAGKTIIAVCHDIRTAFSHADYVVGIKAGKLHGCGSAHAYLKPETISQLFGVKANIMRNESGQSILTLDV